MTTDDRDELGSVTEMPRSRTRAEARENQDDLSELAAAEAVDEDEQELDDMLELDQTELEELGLTLDDPHQPGTE